MPVSLYDQFLGGLSLRQCTAADYSPNGKIEQVSQSGAVDPSLTVLTEATPQASFSTSDLYNMLNALGVQGGLNISAGTIVLAFQEQLQGSTFAGAGANPTLTAANALVVPVSITAAQSAPLAFGDVACHFRSTDGKTDPVTINMNQTLSAQAFQAAYKMGPVKARVAAESSLAQLTGIQSWTMNFGLGVVVTSRDGGVYPTNLFIQTRRPSMDLTFDNFSNLSRFSATATKLVSVTSYLQKYVAGGSFVADGTAEHIALTLTGGIAANRQIGVRENADGSVSQQYTGQQCAVSVAAAISL